MRNSGVTAIVEGVGDHGCEYMTGGRVVVLGLTGRNFAAGMSGGISYVYDVDNKFKSRVNNELVDIVGLENQDLNWLKTIISRHVALTGSARAQEVLADWKRSFTMIRKVLPRDYARAIAEQNKKAKAGSRG